MSKVYKELNTKGLYETFDFAEFLKNNEEFAKAISFYTEILNKINKKHPLRYLNLLKITKTYQVMRKNSKKAGFMRSYMRLEM